MANHGKDAGFLLDDSGGSLASLTANLTSISFPLAKDAAETSVMGLNSKTYIPGMRDATFSIEGIWGSTADELLWNAVASTVTLTFNYGPASTSTGASNPKYSGECICTAYEPPADIGSAVTFSASFQVTGDVTRGVF